MWLKSSDFSVFLHLSFSTHIYMYKTFNIECQRNVLHFLGRGGLNRLPAREWNCYVVDKCPIMLPDKSHSFNTFYGRILPDIFQIATNLPITTLHKSLGRGLSKHSPMNSTTKTPPNHLNWTRSTLTLKLTFKRPHPHAIMKEPLHCLVQCLTLALTIKHNLENIS